MTDIEWQECLRLMDENEQTVSDWPPTAPDPVAARCRDTRHRTLGHLRACQETWLEACEAFAASPEASLKLLHPWRLFDQKTYRMVSWEDHLSAYRADRVRWKALLSSSDRKVAGEINGQRHSIESLTRRLVLHERQHLVALVNGER